METDEATLILVASKPSVASADTVAAITRGQPDVYAFSNEQVVARVDERGFAYFRQISVVLSSIWRHDVATCGTIFPSSSRVTMLSNTLR